MSSINFTIEQGAATDHALQALAYFQEVLEASASPGGDLVEEVEAMNCTVLAKPVQSEGHAFPHFAFIYSGFSMGYTEYLFVRANGEVGNSEAYADEFFTSFSSYSS